MYERDAIAFPTLFWRSTDDYPSLRFKESPSLILEATRIYGGGTVYCVLVVTGITVNILSLKVKHFSQAELEDQRRWLGTTVPERRYRDMRLWHMMTSSNENIFRVTGP